MRAATNCPEAGCPNLQPCSAHARDSRRLTARQRGYDAAWELLRKAHLVREPLCRHCAARGLVTAGTDVDHIVPFVGPEDPLRLAAKNLQTLCHTCHSIKSQADKRLGLGRVSIGDHTPAKSLGPGRPGTAQGASVSLYESGNTKGASPNVAKPIFAAIHAVSADIALGPSKRTQETRDAAGAY